MVEAEGIYSLRRFQVIKKLDHTSETAFLFFVRDSLTEEEIVIKVLRQYKDTRYSLETAAKRQRCVLEALHYNRKFTSDVYVGLGRICEQSEKCIWLDQIIKAPTLKELKPDAEYALLMKRLPDEWQLEHLLKEKRGPELQDIIQTMLNYVAHIHTYLVEPPTPASNDSVWGDTKQLHGKMEHNIGLLKRLPKDQRPLEYDKLKSSLRAVFRSPQYMQAFEQRVQQGWIKRCHGDLKASNIWVEPYERTDIEERWKYIRLLDAIDFNEAYCNIDVLSDFALLVVDIQAYTYSSKATSQVLAEQMIKEYLRLIREPDEKTARLILSFYLVEKAAICAAVSIYDDKEPYLGQIFFEIAMMHAEKLNMSL